MRKPGVVPRWFFLLPLITARSDWRCPITSQVKGYPFEVTIPSGSKLAGVVLADQVKNLDWRVRKAEFICKLPRKTTDEVLQKLGTLLADET